MGRLTRFATALNVVEKEVPILGNEYRGAEMRKKKRKSIFFKRLTYILNFPYSD